MNSNGDNEGPDLIQYQDSQGRWYELFSPTEVLPGQEHEMNQIPHDELQIGNFHLSSTQLFHDLESADEDREQGQPHGFSPPPLREQQTKEEMSRQSKRTTHQTASSSTTIGQQHHGSQPRR